MLTAAAPIALLNLDLPSRTFVGQQPPRRRRKEVTRVHGEWKQLSATQMFRNNPAFPIRATQIVLPADRPSPPRRRWQRSCSLGPRARACAPTVLRYKMIRELPRIEGRGGEGGKAKKVCPFRTSVLFPVSARGGAVSPVSLEATLSKANRC